MRHIYLKILSCLAVSEMVFDLVNKTAAEEQGNVKERYKNSHYRAPLTGNTAKYKVPKQERNVNISKVLRLYGDKEEQQELHIRENRRKCKEQGKVKVIARGIACYKAADKGSDNACQIKDVETEAAPRLLQMSAYHPVKITAYEHKYGVKVVGVENKRDYPPHLSVQHGVTVKIKIVGYGQVGEKVGEDEYYQISYDNVKHKILYIKSSEFSFKLIK